MSHQQEVERYLAEMLSDRPRHVSELAIQLRRHIAKIAPNCSELLYHTYAVSNVFTYTGKLGQAFIHIATYAEHVNLGFNQGAELNDPDSLLEGTGKLIRHIRVDDLKLVKQKNVKALIMSAIQSGIQTADEAGGRKEQSFVVKTK